MSFGGDKFDDYDEGLEKFLGGKGNLGAGGRSG